MSRSEVPDHAIAVSADETIEQFAPKLVSSDPSIVAVDGIEVPQVFFSRFYLPPDPDQQYHTV
jgi:hypothetical protein